MTAFAAIFSTVASPAGLHLPSTSDGARVVEAHMASTRATWAADRQAVGPAARLEQRVDFDGIGGG
jgi:hypothetical protein